MSGISRYEIDFLDVCLTLECRIFFSKKVVYNLVRKSSAARKKILRLAPWNLYISPLGSDQSTGLARSKTFAATFIVFNLQWLNYK